jgi:hypothetical protein
MTAGTARPGAGPDRADRADRADLADRADRAGDEELAVVVLAALRLAGGPGERGAATPGESLAAWRRGRAEALRRTPPH